MLAGVFTVACGNDGPPTQPTGPSPVPIGRGLLNLASRTEDCSAISSGWGFFGPRASATVLITASGSEWVARPETARVGDFELRFRLSGGTAAEGLVAGTMRGTVIDFLSALQFPNPARVAVSGGAAGPDAALTGTSYTQLNAILGTMTGSFTYTDSQGGVTSCTGGSWNLASRDR